MHRMQSVGRPYFKFSRDSSKALSLHASFFRAAVFHLRIVHSDRNH